MEVPKWKVTADLAENHLKDNASIDILRNDINKLIDIIYSSKREWCRKSQSGKHEYILPPDSFDQPYCKHCYKGS